MKGSSKTVLVVLSTLLVLCLCAGAAAFSLLSLTGHTLAGLLNSDQWNTEAVSAEIAGYDLPEGFGDGYAAQMPGFSLVGYTGADGHSHIYLVQADSSTGMTLEGIERQILENTNTTSRSPGSMTRVNVIPGTIRDQEVELVISEGTNHDGEGYRQVSGLFDGNGGPAAVIISMPVSSWDQASVDTFLASIR